MVAGGQLPSQSVGVLAAKLYCLFICSHKFSEFPTALNCSSSLFFLLFLFSFHHFYHCSLHENWVMRSSPRKTEQNWEQKSSGALRSAGSTSGSPSNHCALHSMPKRLHYGRNSKICHCFSALSFVRFFVQSSSFLSSHVDCNGKSGERKNKNRRKPLQFNKPTKVWLEMVKSQVFE